MWTGGRASEGDGREKKSKETKVCCTSLAVLRLVNESANRSVSDYAHKCITYRGVPLTSGTTTFRWAKIK